MTNEGQTKLSVQVVLPNGEIKALRVLVDFACVGVALANANVFGDRISEKYESPQTEAPTPSRYRDAFAGGGTSK